MIEAPKKETSAPLNHDVFSIMWGSLLSYLSLKGHLDVTEFQKWLQESVSMKVWQRIEDKEAAQDYVDVLSFVIEDKTRGSSH